MWRWWPCFIGGFCGPLLAHVLAEWMPPATAVGVAFFIMWVIVGVVFTVSPPIQSGASSGGRVAAHWAHSS